jgi:hypothetical protein
MIADTRLTKVITTLPHLLAAWMTATSHPWYSALVIASTAASALWHYNDDAMDSLYLINHGLAGLWGLVDFWMWPPSIIFNTALLATCPGILPRQIDPMYPEWETWDPTTHADWHLLSVMKAIAVAAALPP